MDELTDMKYQKAEFQDLNKLSMRSIAQECIIYLVHLTYSLL